MKSTKKDKERKNKAELKEEEMQEENDKKAIEMEETTANTSSKIYRTKLYDLKTSENESRKERNKKRDMKAVKNNRKYHVSISGFISFGGRSSL